MKLPKLFQSTLPVWGATLIHPLTESFANKCFNPRSPCGERPRYFHCGKVLLGVSIHAPRVGSDRVALLFAILLTRFQSTLPVWGATIITITNMIMLIVSIHAPRVGSDKQYRVPLFKLAQVSIHAPRVGSDSTRSLSPDTISTFQSTLPVWGATSKLKADISKSKVSIHAPRVGSDNT